MNRPRVTIRRCFLKTRELTEPTEEALNINTRPTLIRRRKLIKSVLSK